MDRALHAQWETITKLRDEYERMNDCSDRRLAHPQIRSYFTAGSELAPGETLYQKTYGLVHDEDCSDELRAQIKEDIRRTFPLPTDPQHTDSLPEHGEWKIYYVGGCEEEPDAPPLHLLIRVPKAQAAKKLPVLYYICGGGFFTSYCDMNEMEIYCQKFNCVVAIPLYRIGQEHPYPQAINDLHAGYNWLITHCEDLNIDTDKIVIEGFSVGGGLGLSFGFRLMRYEYRPRGIVAVFPPMDDRLIYESSKIFSGQFDGYFHTTMYRLYLGKNYASPFLGPEAVPNRATIEECRGFPPVFLHTAELDISRDPALEFAHKVASANSFCELHEWGGSDHMGLLFAQNSPYVERFHAMISANIHDCMTYDLRR